MNSRLMFFFLLFFLFFQVGFCLCFYRLVAIITIHTRTLTFLLVFPVTLRGQWLLAVAVS